MTLPTKPQIAIVTITILVAFALGRYSVSQPDIKTTEQTKVAEQQNQLKDTHTQTRTVVDKLPSGETKTTTVVDTTVTTKTKETINATQNLTQTVTSSKQPLNVSALLAYDYKAGKPTYGLSITKAFIGPITGGLWGLSNGTIGLSVGLNF